MNRDRKKHTLPSSRKPEARTIIPGEEWPEGQLRLVPSAQALAHIPIGNGSWLGLYEGFGGSGLAQVSGGQPSLICCGRSPVALSRKLAKLQVSWPLRALCCKSKHSLPTYLKPEEISEPEKNWRELRRSASEAIGKARSRLDPQYLGLRSIPLKGYDWFIYERLDDGLITKAEAASLCQQFAELAAVLFKIEEKAGERSEAFKPNYSALAATFSDTLCAIKAQGAFRVENKNVQREIDAMLASSDESVKVKFMELETADRFLRDIVKEARKTGKKPGDKATAEENARMVKELRRLLPAGQTRLGATKTVISDDAADPLAKAKSLRTQLRRFCMRVHEARQRTITGQDLYETFGFASGDWPLIERAAAVGKRYAERGRKRKRSETKPPLPMFQQI